MTPINVRKQVLSYGLAIASTILATCVRLLLAPAVGERIPFATYFLAVMITAWYGGLGPAVVALVLGTLAAAHYIIPPHNSLTIEQVHDQISLAIYAAVALVSAFLSESLRAAKARAEQAAAENTRLNQLLKEADQRKDEFLAMLAHELRNPLATLVSGVELLKTADTELAAEVLPMLDRQVHQAVRLVDDLLDLSRVRHGKLVLCKAETDLAAAVGQGVEAVRGLIEEQGHRLEVSLPAEPVLLEADPVRLTQIVTNLLSNAARHSDHPGTIWLNVGREHHEATISVRDQGMGIAPEMLPRLFDLFSQGENGRNRGGLGIGLALVRDLVAMHGGNIVAHSAGLGQGAEFCVRLPLLPQAEVNGETRVPPAAAR